jgi:N-acetylglucosamine malate deacetylase 2
MQRNSCTQACPSEPVLHPASGAAFHPASLHSETGSQPSHHQPSSTILLIAAHPDDETISAANLLIRYPQRTHILHITDGSPQNPADAQAAGCATREQYAVLRNSELLSALALSGIPPSQTHTAAIPDQQAALHLTRIIQIISETIARLRPAIVLTHPYEGGHPDHDACAFAAHAALRSHPDTQLWEFTSYHAGPNGILTGRFLPNSSNPVFTHSLSAPEQQRKQQMFQCFHSQAHMLANFSIEQECFRRAPTYNFAEPPHPGTLHYENYDWGMTGPRWRQLAAAAQTGSPVYAAHHP